MLFKAEKIHASLSCRTLGGAGRRQARSPALELFAGSVSSRAGGHGEESAILMGFSAKN